MAPLGAFGSERSPSELTRNPMRNAIAGWPTSPHGSKSYSLHAPGADCRTGDGESPPNDSPHPPTAAAARIPIGLRLGSALGGAFFSSTPWGGGGVDAA
jgi:hypothetical protein